LKTQAEKAAAFRALHARPGAFVIPNPWDAGTAKLLASLGFEALATTSLGLANMLGRPDGAGAVSRDDVLANCRAISGATDLPVNADLENGYAHEPRAAAEMIRLAAEADVLYAPGLRDLATIRTVVASVGRPLNVVMSAADPALTVAQLAEAGVKRISVGGALSRLALAAFLRGAREMKEHGGFTWVRDTVPTRELKAIFARSSPP
jgi:2-methylisocitrate lyase-like PEP mutase family enzyme